MALLTLLSVTGFDSSVDGWKITKLCSRGQSIHNPITWIPAVGPIIDIIVSPNLQKWELGDAWVIAPIIGPALAYSYGGLDCTYYSYLFEDANSKVKIEDADSKVKIEDADSKVKNSHKLTLSKNQKIPPEIIYMAISESGKNCKAFQDLVYGTIGELGTTESMINSASGAGATAAGLAGAAATSGGLALAGLVMKGMLDDGIEKYFVKGAVENIFETINQNRTILIAQLAGSRYCTSVECQKANANGVSREPFWEFCDNNISTDDCINDQSGMPFGKFKLFLETLDSACTIIQGTSGVKKSLDFAAEQLKKDNPKGDTIKDNEQGKPQDTSDKKKLINRFNVLNNVPY